MHNIAYLTGEEDTIASSDKFANRFSDEFDFLLDNDNDEGETTPLVSSNAKSRYAYQEKVHKYLISQRRQRPLASVLISFFRQSLQREKNSKPAYRRMSSPATAAANAAANAADQLQLPPLRTLDDFILDSARFQLPNLRDWEKWGNRVVKNLLYYQTNYFLLFLTIYLLMLCIYPSQIFCGLLVKALLIAVVIQFFQVKSSSSSSKVSFIASRMPAADSQQKWYILAGVVLVGYLLLYLFDAVLLTLFTLLLPFSVTFIHSSLRLRNMKNKMVNAVESFRPSSPMGMFLDALNIKADGLLG